MEILFALVSGLIAALMLWWSKSSDSRRKGLRAPPGPWGLPIVGHIPFLTYQPYLTLTKLAKRYGNIFSIRLGRQNVVVLNDFQLTKHVFTQDAFISRPPNFPLSLNKETEETGAFFGPPWKEHRRYCLHTLRDLGLGKSKMDGDILEEINELLEHFEKNVEKPFSIRALLAPSTSNNVASLLFGKRFKYDDPTRQMLTRTVRDLSMASGQVSWEIFLPWMRKIFKFLNLGDINNTDNANLELKSYVKKLVDEHEETFNPDNISDFIDAYLLEIQKRKGDPVYSRASLEDLVAIVFAPGTETVRQTVEWLVLKAASDQDAQHRIQAEIQEVIGHNRPPTWPDNKSMPYTNAFIMETMRWRTLVPINLLRYTLTDTELNGYFIPKHTHLLSNLWAIHHDPQYWGSDADEFRPERFLCEEDNQVKKWERYVPFSIGKRSCPGESMAKVEIFLYFVSILQRFGVKLPKGKEADFEGELGITLQIKSQDIVLTKRVS